MATPLVLAASTIRYRSSKKEKKTTKITYDYKKPLKTVITTVFSGLLMFKLMATNGSLYVGMFKCLYTSSLSVYWRKYGANIKPRI